MIGKVYLIPATLHDDETALRSLPAYVLDAVKDCNVFFVENERTARRYFKKLWKEMQIDDYEWHAIHRAEEEVRTLFIESVRAGKNVGIVSEAGCPGVADPGQILVRAAQELKAKVIPLVGPSSILLALMASGMNGQAFQFVGYLPIEPVARKKVLRELEADSSKRDCTQIFIETPYRNDQLLRDIFSVCHPETRICIAVDLTAETESIRTRTVRSWQGEPPQLHKRPAIFLLHART